MIYIEMLTSISLSTSEIDLCNLSAPLFNLVTVGGVNSHTYCFDLRDSFSLFVIYCIPLSVEMP